MRVEFYVGMTYNYLDTYSNHFIGKWMHECVWCTESNRELILIG